MGPLGFQQGITPRKPNLKNMMEGFMVTQNRQNEKFRNQNLQTNEVLR